jgi:ferritin
MYNKMALISEKFNEALNAQVKEELYSAYLYLGMSYWLKGNNFNNLGEWYFMQYNEELAHAYKFMDYIVETSGNVKLHALDEPKIDWQNVEEIVNAGYTHEQFITGKINDLVVLAEELKEFPPRELLQWFISEQIEEEASASELVDRQKAFRNDMLFDHHTHRVTESSSV